MVLTDTVKLATTTVDGYGDKTITVLTSVKALFIQRTSATHNQHIDTVESDATIYLDARNPVVLANAYRLEGMYIIAQPFGQTDGEAWYKIVNMTVGQRKLLNNVVENIHCQLDKIAGLAYVS
jgi:hypothetical protein